MPRQRMSFKLEIPARLEGMTFIYALTDPISGEVRYVGKSDTPKLRLMGHLYGRERDANTYKARWIRKLQSAGLTPGLVILEQVPQTEWQFFEMGWILKFRQSGAKLTNTTDGGEGTNGVVWSEESRKKLSDAQKLIFVCAGEKARQRVDAMRRRKPDASKRFLTSEHVGVSKVGEFRYRAFMPVNGKRIHLGYFRTLEGAIEARKTAEVNNQSTSITQSHGVRTPRTGREGMQGVTKHKNRWIAYFNIAGKQTTLGSFTTFEEALSVRRNAENGNIVIHPRKVNPPRLKPEPRLDRFGVPVSTKNTSGVKGVSYMPARNRWQAYIQVLGKTIPLGKFTNFEDAVAARKAAEEKHYAVIT